MADDNRDIEIRVKAKEETAGVFARVREQMEQLKKGAGRGSPIGELGETLKGGGVVLGFTLISKALGDAATQAIELRKEFEAGTISLGEMNEKLIGQIPIFGEIWSAGRAIRELFTGDEAALEAAKEESDRVNESIQRRIELMRESNQQHEQERIEIEALRGQAGVIGQRGLAGQLATEHENQHQETEQSKKQTQQQLDAEQTRADTELKKIRDRKEIASKNLADLQRADASNPTKQDQYFAGPGGGVFVPKSNVEDPAIKDAQEKLNQAQQDEKQELKRSTDEKAKIAADGKARAAALDAKSDAEQKEIKRQNDIDIENQTRESESRVRAIRAQSNQAQLRTLGNELGAELDEINSGATAQIEAIERAADAAKEKNPERSADIDRQKQKEEAAVQEDAAIRRTAAARKAANDQADKQFSVESLAQSAKIEALQSEASLGSAAKQIELERAEIAEKYREKREQISKQLREDLTLTQQQRQILQQTLGGLDAQEKREEKIAAIKRASKFELAQSDTDRDVSGVALAFKAQLSGDLAKRIGDATASGPGGAGVGPGFAGGAAGRPGAAAAENTAANTSKSNDLLSQLLQSFNQNFQQLLQVSQGNATAQPIFLN